MAQLPNSAALTVSDGLNTFFNIDTSGKHESHSNADVSFAQSSSAPDPGNAGTIATAGVAVARIAPAAAETGLILQAGTQPGQLCLVVNEAAVANTATFDVSGTSNVADGTNNVIPGHHARLYTWDSSTSLWYASAPTVLGTIATKVSATSPDPGAGGTIATAGVGVALVTPTAARSGIILQAGTYTGQEVWVVNQGSAANTLTFAAAGTSNVADGTGTAIAGVTARKFVWVAATSLWYRAA